jgi:hypothetical protein
MKCTSAGGNNPVDKGQDVIVEGESGCQKRDPRSDRMLWHEAEWPEANELVGSQRNHKCHTG